MKIPSRILAYLDDTLPYMALAIVLYGLFGDSFLSTAVMWLVIAFVIAGFVFPQVMIWKLNSPDTKITRLSDKDQKFSAHKERRLSADVFFGSLQGLIIQIFLLLVLPLIPIVAYFVKDVSKPLPTYLQFLYFDFKDRVNYVSSHAGYWTRLRYIYENTKSNNFLTSSFALHLGLDDTLYEALVDVGKFDYTVEQWTRCANMHFAFTWPVGNVFIEIDFRVGYFQDFVESNDLFAVLRPVFALDVEIF